MTEENSPEWQAPPPPPPDKEIEPPQMSELGSLGNIFFEPGRTFEDLRRKPRFIAATIIMTLLITAFSFGLYYKVGEARMRDFAAEQMSKSRQTDAMSREDKEKALDIGMTIGKVVRFVLPVFLIIFFMIGGLIYWVSAKAFGGDGSYLQALSTWVYASFPPTVVSMLGNFVALAFKNVDDIDIGAAQNNGGILPASAGALIDANSMPMIAAVLNMVDLFLIWGWVLGIIGLQRTLRLSSGSAWTITVVLIVIQLSFRLLRAAF